MTTTVPDIREILNKEFSMQIPAPGKDIIVFHRVSKRYASKKEAPVAAVHSVSIAGPFEAVTVTGGEPTVQRDLFEFIGKIKSRGFLVKLDTQGTNPRAVERLLSAGLVDYVAMDIKAPLDRYREVANCFVDEAAVRKTIGIIMSSAPDYEFRTTIVKGQLGMDDMRRIGELIKGAKCHYSQKFVPNGNLNDPLFASRTGLTDAEMEETRRLMSGYVTNAFTR